MHVAYVGAFAASCYIVVPNAHARRHEAQSKHASLLQAFSYRGPGDPGEEALHYVVQTSSIKAAVQKAHQIPSLPSGSLITGLAAAAIQHCQVTA